MLTGLMPVGPFLKNFEGPERLLLNQGAAQPHSHRSIVSPFTGRKVEHAASNHFYVKVVERFPWAELQRRSERISNGKAQKDASEAVLVFSHSIVPILSKGVTGCAKQDCAVSSQGQFHPASSERLLNILDQVALLVKPVVFPEPYVNKASHAAKERAHSLMLFQVSLHQFRQRRQLLFDRQPRQPFWNTDRRPALVAPGDSEYRNLAWDRVLALDMNVRH